MLQRILRLLKHRWSERSSHLISSQAMARLTLGVADSEQRHSGQIRLCIESALPVGYLLRDAPTAILTRERALAQFSALGVWDTEGNNGVLIYLLLAEQAIEVIADRGLNAHVSAEQWRCMIDRLGTSLRAERFEEGLTQALAEVSIVLEQHFPRGDGTTHVNELSDQPVLT